MSSKVIMVGIAAFLVAGVAVTVSKFDASKTGASSSMPQGQGLTAAQRARIVVPALGLSEKRGEAAFNANCIQCHGKNAGGTDQGPPFLNAFYVPSHHDNGAFLRAVKNGVRPHHWSFGPMPAQPQVSAGDLQAIIAYVRAMQRANGFY